MNDAPTSSGNDSGPTQVKKNVWPVFVSYRRSDLTRRIALWLKQELERETIRATTGQIFNLRVFVDVAESHQSDFQAHLVPYLQHSRALVLVTDEDASSRKTLAATDYLYEELDWWAVERKKTPPIILQLDSKSAGKLVSDSKFKHWRKVSFIDCFWEKWAGESDGGKAEREQLLRTLRESIRNYGQIIHLEEVRRLRRLVWLAALLAVAALIAAGIARLQYGTAVQQRDIASQNAEETVETLSRSDFFQAVALVKQDRGAEALPYLARSLREVPRQNPAASLAFKLLLTQPIPYGHFQIDSAMISSPYCESESKIKVVCAKANQAWIWDVVANRAVTPPMAHAADVQAAVFSPDGSKVVTWAGSIIRVWKCADGLPLTPELKLDDEPQCVVFSSDGECIAAAVGTEVVVRKSDGGAILNTFELEQAADEIALCKDGKTLLTTYTYHDNDGEEHRLVQAYDLKSGHAVKSPLNDDDDSIQDKIILSSSGYRYLEIRGTSHGADGGEYIGNGAELTDASEVTDLQTSAVKKPDFEQNDDLAQKTDIKTDEELSDAKFSNDESYEITRSNLHRIQVWDKEGNSLTSPIQAQNDISHVFLSNDKKCALGQSDHRIDIWDLKLPDYPNVALTQSGCDKFEFSPDSSLLLGFSETDGTVQLWKANTLKKLPFTVNLPEQDASATFTSAGLILATSGNILRLLDPSSGKDVINPPLRCPQEIKDSEVSSDGQYILVNTDDSTLLWSFQGGHWQSRPLPLEHSATASFSPDGKMIVGYSSDSLQLFNVEDMKSILGPIKFAVAHKSDDTDLDVKGLDSAFVTTDGKILVALCPTGPPRMWNISEKQEIPSVPESDFNYIAVGSDGKMGIRTPNNDPTIFQVVDLQNHEPITLPAKICDRDLQLETANFSSDNSRICFTANAIGNDFTAVASMWDVGSGALISPDVEEGDNIRDYAISPDGRRLITVTGPIEIWDMAPMTNPPSWLSDMLEAVAGFSLNKRGMLEQVAPEKFDQQRAARVESKSPDPWEIFGKWFFTAPSQRSVSPWSLPGAPGRGNTPD